jgi:hypothetical protein
MLEKHPTRAKAHPLIAAVCGTTKVVPFQNIRVHPRADYTGVETFMIRVSNQAIASFEIVAMQKMGG